jgi:hypothetical protein
MPTLGASTGAWLGNHLVNDLARCKDITDLLTKQVTGAANSWFEITVAWWISCYERCYGMGRKGVISRYKVCSFIATLGIS